LESVEPIRDKHPLTFVWIEHTATAVFAVEYVARLWVCVDYRNGRFRHPLWGRLRYVRSFYAIINLIAVLPSLLGLLGSGDLRVLRLLRLLRMLKLARRSRTFSLLWAAFREEAHSITALVFSLCLTLTISAALMYLSKWNSNPQSLIPSLPPCGGRSRHSVLSVTATWFRSQCRGGCLGASFQLSVSVHSRCFLV
jgi:voltage-gated potassium channel